MTLDKLQEALRQLRAAANQVSVEEPHEEPQQKFQRFTKRYNTKLLNDLIRIDNVFIDKFYKLSTLFIKKYCDQYGSDELKRKFDIVQDIYDISGDSFFLMPKNVIIDNDTLMPKNVISSNDIMFSFINDVPEYYVLHSIWAIYNRNKMFLLSYGTNSNRILFSRIANTQTWPIEIFNTLDSMWRNHFSKTSPLGEISINTVSFTHSFDNNNLLQIYADLDNRFSSYSEFKTERFDDCKICFNNSNNYISSKMEEFKQNIDKPLYLSDANSEYRRFANKYKSYYYNNLPF
jgi:hypothetical protein